MNKSPIGVWITDTHLSEDTVEINFNIFTQVFYICEQLAVNTIFHGGDIFTSRKGQPEIVLNAFKSILDIAAEKKLKIVAIAGNHDKTSYVNNTSFIDAFDGHPAFSVVSPYGSLIVSDGNTIVSLCPYYDEHLLYKQKLIELTNELDPQFTNILLTHIAVDEVKNNSGSKVQNEIKQELFDVFNLVLVGHYHNRQILGKKRSIVYTGSSYQANFGEDDQKGCTVIYDDASYEFVDLDFPKYVTLEILGSDIDNKLISKISKSKKDGNTSNLRFKIVGEIEESKKSLIVELQQLAKVEIIKESYKPVDIVQSESVIINDILLEYDTWSKSKEIRDVKYGREILSKCI